MGSNIKQFEAQLDQFHPQRTERDFLLLRRKVVLFCITGVMKRTPVDLGTLRGNWQTTIGAPSEKILNKKTRRISDAINNALLVGRSFPFENMFITNNLEYAIVVEEGGYIPKNPGKSKDRRKRRRGRIWVVGGFSVQAPQGMVAITVADARTTKFEV